MARPLPLVGTVDVMADLPFGFSPGDDPDRDKHGKQDPSASNPLGAFGLGGNFGMGDLGQIFTQLGQMFSSAGTSMASGNQTGPVNYELAGQVASKTIGFVAPIPAST